MSAAIDVVCAAWNAAATLGETLASVAAQTRQPSRIIVADDGSSDATAELAAGAGADVLRLPHRGVAAAQNAGIAESRAVWLAFIDADDLWPPGKLEMQGRLLEETGADGVLGLVETFPCPTLPAALGHLAGGPPQAGWLTGALLIRCSAFDSVGPFDETLAAGHAVDWFDRARRAGLRLLMPEEIVLRRRIRPGSLSQRSRERDEAYVAMARLAIARRRQSGGGEGG